jgi:hypothetical protein
MVFQNIRNTNMFLHYTEADELQQKILSILNGDFDPASFKEATAPSPKRRKEGEKVGNLVVPLPSEPLGALDDGPKLQSAINSLANPADYSVFYTYDFLKISAYIFH